MGEELAVAPVKGTLLDGELVAAPEVLEDAGGWLVDAVVVEPLTVPAPPGAADVVLTVLVDDSVPFISGLPDAGAGEDAFARDVLEVGAAAGARDVAVAFDMELVVALVRMPAAVSAVVADKDVDTPLVAEPVPSTGAACSDAQGDNDPATARAISNPGFKLAIGLPLFLLVLEFAFSASLFVAGATRRGNPSLP